MKKYSVNDISRLVLEAKPRFIALEDEKGNRLIPFNKMDAPVKEHLIKICNRLKAEVLADGIYYVTFSETSAKGGVQAKLQFVKGEIETIAPASPITEPPPSNTKSMSQEKIMELIQENADLKAKLGTLELENKYLQEDIKSLEDELAEEENKPPALPVCPCH